MLDVLLFTTDTKLASRAFQAGITGFVVDWETRAGDAARAEVDVGSRPDSADDLRAMSSIEDARLYCRLNRPGPRTAEEVECALACGATHLIVPMVECAADVEHVMALVKGRVPTGIMIETDTACRAATDIASVPVDFVYAGLLDLAISRREGNVFRAFADGTADHLREVFAGVQFGIGGVTAISGGCPVPAPELLGELARLDTNFAFARRSFLRDMAGRDLRHECRRIAEVWTALGARDAALVAADHARFVRQYGASRSIG